MLYTTTSGQRKKFELLLVPHICEPLLAQPVDFCSIMYIHLTSLNLSDTYYGDTLIVVDMIVGSNFYWKLTTEEIVRRRRWTCCHQYQVWVDTLRTGNASEDDNGLTVMTVHTLQVDAVSDEQLDKMLRSFWELKSLGLEPFYDITQDPARTVELKDG